MDITIFEVDEIDLEFDSFELWCLSENLTNVNTLKKYRKALEQKPQYLKSIYDGWVERNVLPKGFGLKFIELYKNYNRMLEKALFYKLPNNRERALLGDLMGRIIPYYQTPSFYSDVFIRDIKLKRRLSGLSHHTLEYLDIEIDYLYGDDVTIMKRYSPLIDINYRLKDVIKREFEKGVVSVNISLKYLLLTKNIVERYGKLLVGKFDEQFSFENFITNILTNDNYFRNFIIVNDGLKIMISGPNSSITHTKSLTIYNTTFDKYVPVGQVNSNILEKPFFTIVNNNLHKENYMDKINLEELAKHQKEIELSIENKFLERTLERMKCDTPGISLSRLFSLVTLEYSPMELMLLSFSSFKYIEKLLDTLYSKYDFNWIVVKHLTDCIYIYKVDQSRDNRKIEKITLPINLQSLEVDKLYMLDRSSDTTNESIDKITKANVETLTEYETRPIGWNTNLARQQPMVQQPSNQSQSIPQYQYDQLSREYQTLYDEKHKVDLENKKLRTELTKLKHIIEYLERH